MDSTELASRVFEEDVACPSWTSDEHKYPKEAESYELQKEVGHGSTATVWAARCRETGEYVAVKIFFLDHMKGDKGRAVQEVITNRSLRHPAILPVLAHFQDGSQHVWMVTPFINGGSVASLITQRHPQGLEEAAILGIAFPVLQALSFMHELSLMHRDVKAANVLVSETGLVYLGDYGVVAPVQHLSGRSMSGGRERERLKARQDAVLSQFAGTPAWMAPEVVAPNEDIGYDERADIWSFGILLIEMAHGKAPYVDEPLETVVTSVANGEPPVLQADEDERIFSPEFRALVARCLHKDPTERPSAKQLLQDGVFKAPLSDGKLVEELFALPQHNSNKMHRVPSRVKSMKGKNLEAVLQEEISHALGMLQKATAPGPSQEKDGKAKEESHHHRLKLLRRPHPASRLTPQDLAACKGLVFGRAYRHGTVVKSAASGIGFAVARHVTDGGELYWSAPTFLNVVGHGVGLALGAEELSFVLVLRDYDHLLSAAAAETVTRANINQNLVGKRMSLQLLLGNGHHTSKIISFADGKMFDMTILGWNLGPDSEMNERVYGEDTEPSDILDGKVRPPPECSELYDRLQSLESDPEPARAKSDLSLRDPQRGFDSSAHATEKTVQPQGDYELERRASTVHGGSAAKDTLECPSEGSTGSLRAL